MWKPQGIYTEFILDQPTILFGENAILGLSSFPGSRIAVISSTSANVGILETIKKVFKRKVVININRSWNGEPDLSNIRNSIEELENSRPDVIIAVGGGSVIDGAKLCRLFYEFPFFNRRETRINQLSFKTKFIAIPTTIGSGAEASSAAVFVNKEEKRKEMIVAHDLRADVVVLNPEYVRSAPEKIIISSSLDAVGHIVEGYISLRNNGFIDIYAEKALDIFLSELKAVNRNYLRLQYAGYLGGVIQNHCLVGVAHALSHQLSDFGYSHGEAVALLISDAIRQNIKDCKVKDRINILCSRAGISDYEELICFIEKQVSNAGIGSRKKELYDLLLRLFSNNAFIENVINDMGGKGNPIPITKDYLNDYIRGFGDGL